MLSTSRTGAKARNEGAKTQYVDAIVHVIERGEAKLCSLVKKDYLVLSTTHGRRVSPVCGVRVVGTSIDSGKSTTSATDEVIAFADISTVTPTKLAQEGTRTDAKINCLLRCPLHWRRARTFSPIDGSGHLATVSMPAAPWLDLAEIGRSKAAGTNSQRWTHGPAGTRHNAR